MDKYTIGTFDVSTNNLVIRDMTSEEVEKLKKEAAEEVARQAEYQAAADAFAALKTSARAKLVAGTPLTEEEAATLVI